MSPKVVISIIGTLIAFVLIFLIAWFTKNLEEKFNAQKSLMENFEVNDSVLILRDVIHKTDTTVNLAKDQLIFINFWATWCKPCIEEMASLEKLYQRENSEVTFLFPSFEDVDVIHRFVASRNWQIPIFAADSTQHWPFNFMPTQYPTTIILKNKELKYFQASSRDWEKFELNFFK